MCRIALSLVFILVLTNTATAGIKARAYTLSPMAGGHFIDADQQLRNSLFWAIGLGYNLTDRAALEAVFSQTDANGKSAPTNSAVIRSGRIDALYHFRPDQQFVPYLATGFGEIIINPDSGSNRDHWLANVGGGIKYFFNDRVALRADLRYLLDFPEPQHNLLCSAGLFFQFGKPPEAPAPTATAPHRPRLVKPTASLGRNGDGIKDTHDQCSGTLPGIRNETFDCQQNVDSLKLTDVRDLSAAHVLGDW